MKRGISKFRAFAYLIFFMIIGVVFIAVAFKNYNDAKKPIYDLNNLNISEVEPGMRVRGPAHYVLSAFATYGNETETDNRCYMLLAGSDEPFYIGLEVKRADFDNIDKQVDLTWKAIESNMGIDDESYYYIDGVVSVMSKELQRYYEEYFTDSELYTQKDVEDMYFSSILPYYVELTSGTPKGNGDILLFAGIAFIVLGVLICMFTLWRIKKQEKELDALNFKMGAASIVTAGMTDNAGSGTAFSDDKKPPMGFE